MLSRSFILFSLAFTLLISCNEDIESLTSTPPSSEPKAIDLSNLDLNKNGKIDIMVLGTSKSIRSDISHSSMFSPNDIANQLEIILKGFNELSETEINVVAEDIYAEKMISFGKGNKSGNPVLTATQYHYRHSLVQYIHWPEGENERLINLKGEGANDWDYVIISADPYIISHLPGYFALGVNKIVDLITEGGAKPLLLLQWPKNSVSSLASFSHFEEFTYRVADGTSSPLEVVPVGLAWNELKDSKNDDTSPNIKFPTANGAYLSAASIFSQITNLNASLSNYSYDDEIADQALTTKQVAATVSHYSGDPNFVSPYSMCNILDKEIKYHEQGSSSEDGIEKGLIWVFNQSDIITLKRTNITSPPLHFYFGRANTDFEADKRYKMLPAKYNFTFGFPMQDHGTYGDTGNVSMLYGIDKRFDDTENGTDLGVSRYMVENNEIYMARALPIRTLYALMKDADPSFTAYRDAWHMSTDLDKATAAFMYTMLTGECVLGSEPVTANELKNWSAQKIGHETALIMTTFQSKDLSCD